jgi:hypothetical protein
MTTRKRTIELYRPRASLRGLRRGFRGSRSAG